MLLMRLFAAGNMAEEWMFYDETGNLARVKKYK
jgi:hypothetical protein